MTAATPMPASDEPWCIIPVYNNAATIADIALRCRAQLARVIVVDDGSTDADLRDLLKDVNVEVLRHQTNRGKGAALTSAFRHAAGHGARYVITLDGDGQHFPEDIPRFLPHLARDTILIGQRREISGTMPRSSRFGRDFSDFWIEVETGAAVNDSQSGFRAYPLQEVLGLHVLARHYNFEMEILTRALWAGLRVQSVPIRVWYAERSQRVSSFRPFVDNARISLVHARLVARQLLPLLPPPLALQGRREETQSPIVGRFRARPTPLSPLNLAAAAAIGFFFGILLWPLGILPVLYVAWRLHLNKIMALLAVAMCVPRTWPRWCAGVGRLLWPQGGPHEQVFVGAHLVAFVTALLAACSVYFVTRGLQSNDERRQRHPR